VRPAFWLLVLAPLACGVHYASPTERAHDARFGFLAGVGRVPNAHAACAGWSGTLGARDPYATSHVSFPETAPEVACFTRVVHQGRSVLVGHVPSGCAVPTEEQRASMRALADRLAGERDGENEPLLPCTLRPDHRRAALRQNASALRSAAALPGTYPYSALVVPGYGEAQQAEASVVDWKPGDVCPDPEPADRQTFGAMNERAARAADALRARVAPLAIVSGGAPHSRAVEAFELMYLLECVERVPAEAVLVEPCADHTHTNLRNGARWLVATGGRTAYIVTDEGMQSDYLQEGGVLSMLGAAIDQRSLRDWGYIIGSWRQASVGTEAGFWFSPFRFWAEPREGLGSLTCVRP
jgi:hypothetical protein